MGGHCKGLQLLQSAAMLSHESACTAKSTHHQECGRRLCRKVRSIKGRSPHNSPSSKSHSQATADADSQANVVACASADSEKGRM